MEVIREDISMLKEKIEGIQIGQAEIRTAQVGLIRNISNTDANVRLILSRLDVVDRMIETQVKHGERIKSG